MSSRWLVTVVRQLLLRRFAWNRAFSRWTNSTTKRLYSSPLSWRPKLSISSATLSQSTASADRVRISSACAIAQAWKSRS